MEPLILFPVSPTSSPPCARVSSFSPAPAVAVRSSCHTGPAGGYSLPEAYSGSSPSSSRESECVRLWGLSGWLEAWPHPLEPMGRARKSSAGVWPPGRGLWICCCCSRVVEGTGRGQGRGWTFVWVLLRARNFTGYLKVPFVIRLEAQVIISCLSAPFCSHCLEESVSSWVAQSFCAIQNRL